jgi:hypothetical protein
VAIVIAAANAPIWFEISVAASGLGVLILAVLFSPIVTIVAIATLHAFDWAIGQIRRPTSPLAIGVTAGIGGGAILITNVQAAIVIFLNS